ncbi:energy transducer TonB [Mucilaginibacter antarcticus]|uniref:Energy transducer TonB n=1 Tax=Mucilaginibacter antarcticus TaxID=1855725 RepID=A0ABW5XM76_9SPHI
MNYTQQENNYPKAFGATGVILLLIAALCYFLVFGPPPAIEDGTGGILVNYGTTEEGMGSDYMNTQEPSMAEKANNTRPDKVTPTPPTEEKSESESSDRDIVTQNTEDAPEVAAPTKKPSTAVAKENTKVTPNPKVNTNALYQGKTNNATGEGDGTTGKPGNQGKTTGSTLATNYDGTGSGNGGSLNMTQRSFTSRPKIEDNGRHTGKVVVELRVDKNGNVVYARAGARGTTIVDAALLQKCEDAVKNSRLTAADTELQSGNVVFVFKVN